MAGTLHTLRLTSARWDAIPDAKPTAAIATVLGAWVLLAWSRLGIQGMSAPRTATRFVLVGVYSWLLMAAVVYLVGWLADRFGRPAQGSFRPARIMQLTGLCHQPLAMVGFVMLFGVLLPVQEPVTLAAVAGVGLWMPAMLVVAMRSMMPDDRAVGMVAGLAGYLIWVATAGRYLLDRVGHLV